MQLIDHLEERADSIGILESVSQVTAKLDAQVGWYLLVDDASYKLSEPALDTLLNLLRIPIKYIHRCVESEGGWLAEHSINYWISKFGEFSFLIEDLEVTQVFPGKRLYLPSVKVNDFILEYLQGEVEIQSFTMEDDIFNAVYLTDQEVQISEGIAAKLGVRVRYSDCFTITPRFDGVLYEPVSGAVFCYPTLGRKFRVASNTVPQVIDQIEEFVDLSLQGLKEVLVPALSNMNEWDIRSLDFVTRLCSDLRLSRKIRDELMFLFAEEVEGTNDLYLSKEVTVMEAIRTIAAFKDGEHIDMGVARDIQIALSNYAIKGSFK